MGAFLKPDVSMVLENLSRNFSSKSHRFGTFGQSEVVGWLHDAIRPRSFSRESRREYQRAFEREIGGN